MQIVAQSPLAPSLRNGYGDNADRDLDSRRRDVGGNGRAAGLDVHLY